jgi:DNA-binding transcriptional LysR family regulator
MQLRHGQNIPIGILRSFVAISEHGSFTKAAEELHLTQPAISAQIKRLQRLVGGDVFIKKAMGVGLSELGLMVERYARRILALNDQVIGIAGRAPKTETIHIGIQSIFGRTVLSDVVNTIPITTTARYRFVCGNASYLAEKLKSGYVDLVFMLSQTESRRGLLAEWNERPVWVRAPNFSLLDDEPIPYVSLEKGFINRKVLETLEEGNVPYRIVFSAVDLWNLTAAAEAGIGVLVTMERVLADLSDTLIVAKDRILPRLPELRAGVFFREGFDVKRNRLLVEAFVSAVQPPGAAPIRIARRSEQGLPPTTHRTLGLRTRGPSNIDRS